MRILIIEDEDKIASFVKAALMAQHYAVDVASDGERGLYLALTNDYDLIILDNILPKKEGMQVCREIREKGRTVPILILSVKSQTMEKADLLNAGADDYLTKPFALEELLARIAALLRRGRSIARDVMTIEDIVLDSKAGTVTRKKKPVQLTRREFSLLEYLMRNEDIVLSRSMLLEHVWDMSVDLFSNTIESHIFCLRKKLNDMGKDKIIQTVPGRGYRMAARSRPQ